MATARATSKSFAVRSVARLYISPQFELALFLIAVLLVVIASPIHFFESTIASQQLSDKGQAELACIVKAGELAELTHPDFAKYRGEVEKFYRSLNGSLAWLREGQPTPQALGLISILETAHSEGLDVRDYDGHLWGTRLHDINRPNPAESVLIRFDVALTVSAMRYVSDLHIGRVNPRNFHFDLDVGNKTLQPSDFLQTLVNSSDVNSAIEALEPPFPSYRRTRAALNTYDELAQHDTGERLPPRGYVIRPGDSYVAVPQLRRLLVLLGDLPEKQATPFPDSRYESALVDAVKHFQQRHGVDPNGIIDKLTLGELNMPLSHRITQLQLTLERFRWLPHNFNQPPIIVNIPEFRLRAVDKQYHWVVFMKVVVGGAFRHRTPVFASSIRSIVFRPSWNVPRSIVRAELLPHLDHDPSYLNKHSYEITDRVGNVTNASLNADVKRQLYSGNLRIRQKPGPANALGLIKFDFPNVHDVYMHGTPASELFNRSRRDFSHGCIRVEDPVALAVWLLRDKPGWTADRIRSAMAAEQTFRVDLKQPVPVLIVYGTAVVMEDGEVRFFKDIYGQDAQLVQAIASRNR